MRCRLCKREIPENSLYCCWCGKYQLKKNTLAVSVPKPIQLPSGNWRIQLRKEGASIVEPTPDKAIVEAKRVRKQWLIDDAAGLHADPEPVITLRSVVDSYINSRKAKRALTTIRGYESYANNHFQSFMDQDVCALDTQDMIDREMETDISAKTIHNCWGLISSSLKAAKVQFDPPVLPKMTPKDRNWLDYRQIELFLIAIRDQDCELGALLGLHSLRASEIFGLRRSDYDPEKQIIHVRGAMHRLNGNEWVRVDTNKNETSRRDIPILIPRLKELLDAIPKQQEYIIGSTQPYLYERINTLCANAGLPQTGCHGLRHSFASLASHLGWKKKSTMKIGGWKNSRVLDEIYTHNADLDADLQTMRDFFMST